MKLPYFLVFLVKSQKSFEMMAFLYIFGKYLVLCWYVMEKQDPWLRAACYVVEKYVEQTIEYIRMEISELLSQSKNNDRRKILLMKNIFKDNNIPRWFDDFTLRDNLFKFYAGEFYGSTHDDFREIYTDSIQEYKLDMIKLNLIYHAIQIYLSDITKTAIQIPLWDENIVIEDKKSMLDFLSIVNIPDHIINQAKVSTLTTEESEHILSIDKDSFRFQLSCHQLITTILDPLIAKRQEELTWEYADETSEGLLNTLSNKLNSYQDILENTEEKSNEWNDLNQFIKHIEASIEEVEKDYLKKLKQAQRIKQILNLFKLLKESIIYSSRSGKPFIFLQSEYRTEDDIVLLAEILLYEYKLKTKFPKWQRLLWNLRRYINSYKK